MKVASRVIAMALLVSASVVRADTQVWFTASNPTGAASIQTPGGPGSSPVLKCDVTLAPVSCSWTITMAFQNGVGDSPIIGWATDLYSAALNGKIAASNLVYPAGFSVHPAGGFTGPSPGLLVGGNGFDGSFAGVNGGTLATFTLTKTKQAGASGSQTDIINGVVGDVAWGNLDGAAPNLQVGGNAVVPEANPGADLGGVITIMNFPEPSSLALLGLGALAMIRRRR